MQRIERVYRSLLLKCEAEHRSFREVDLLPSRFSEGRHYQGDLLVVGRAVNGGEHDFCKHDTEYFRGIERGPLPFLEVNSLDWVDVHAGAERKYNSNRSAFWRVTRKLAEGLIGKGSESLHYIACSNLYKISALAGNPGDSLAAVQLELCIELLNLEIEELRPKHVVFLTGYNWIRDFLGALDYREELDVSGLVYLDGGWRAGGRNFIAAQHPQGKAEAPHVEEILNGLKRLSSH